MAETASEWGFLKLLWSVNTGSMSLFPCCGDTRKHFGWKRSTVAADQGREIVRWRHFSGRCSAAITGYQLRKSYMDSSRSTKREENITR